MNPQTDDEDFWREKFLRDFGQYKYPVESWKNLYRDTGNIFNKMESSVCQNARDLLHKYKKITVAIHTVSAQPDLRIVIWVP